MCIQSSALQQQHRPATVESKYLQYIQALIASLKKLFFRLQSGVSGLISRAFILLLANINGQL
jgi:hypothetical protein